MSYFIEHVWFSIVPIALISLFMGIGLLSSVFVDVDHTGTAKLKLSCALRNSREACPPNQLGRGIFHNTQLWMQLTLAVIAINILWLGLTLHLTMDQILW